MESTEVLAMVGGHVDEELLLRNEYVQHCHCERNHQGMENRLLFPEIQPSTKGIIARNLRMGGLLNFYYRKAA